MLLQPLEEQLDLPAIVVEFCNHHWADIQRVGEEDKLPLLLFVPVNNAPDFLGVLEAGLLAVHVPDGIGQNAGSRRKSPRPFPWLEVVVLLSPDDEVGANRIDPEQSLEVIVSAVEDIERVLFIRDDVH